MTTLKQLRDAIDTVDDAVITLLAERFEITRRIGELKAEQGLAGKDPQREAQQVERLCNLANRHGLAPELAQAYLSLIIEHVLKNHQALAATYKRSSPPS